MASFNPSFTQYITSETSNTSNIPSSLFLLGRVTHVVRGPLQSGTQIPDQYYKNPTSLGNITFQLVSSIQSNPEDSKGNEIAIPLFSNFKQYPIQNELVYILPGPSIEMNESRGNRSYFYLSPYNLWNASHHNAFPDLGVYAKYVFRDKRNYRDVDGLKQSTNLSATGSVNFPLDPDFIEKRDIKSLRQFAGDVTIEGRWGNSIRLGSISLNDRNQNTWSKTGEPGNPITIIRNGQGRSIDDVPWIPTVENINRDPSSIYLTNGQEIIINDLKEFSLASLATIIASPDAIAIPIQQQLTSTEILSPAEQDRLVRQTTNPDLT